MKMEDFVTTYYLSRVKVRVKKNKPKCIWGIMDSSDNVEEFYTLSQIKEFTRRGIPIEGVEKTTIPVGLLFRHGGHFSIGDDFYCVSYRTKHGECAVKASVVNNLEVRCLNNIITYLAFNDPNANYNARLSDFCTSLSSYAIDNTTSVPLFDAILVVDNKIKKWNLCSFGVPDQGSWSFDIREVTRPDLVSDIYYDFFLSYGYQLVQFGVSDVEEYLMLSSAVSSSDLHLRRLLEYRIIDTKDRLEKMLKAYKKAFYKYVDSKTSVMINKVQV